MKTRRTRFAGEFNFADVEGDSLDHVTIVAGPAAGGFNTQWQCCE